MKEGENRVNRNSGLLCPYEDREDFRCSMGINKTEGYVCGGYGTCPYEEEKKREANEERFDPVFRIKESSGKKEKENAQRR
jgi:hypothetical protein